MENMWFEGKFDWKLNAVEKVLNANKNFITKPRRKLKFYWHFSLHHTKHGYVGAVDCLDTNRSGGGDIKEEVDAYRKASKYFCVIELFPSAHDGKEIPASWIKRYVGSKDYGHDDDPFVWTVRTAEELERGLKDMNDSYETDPDNDYTTTHNRELSVTLDHVVRDDVGTEISLGKAIFYKSGGKLVVCYSVELEDQARLGKFFKIKDSHKNVKFKKNLGKMKRKFSNLKESKMRI